MTLPNMTFQQIVVETNRIAALQAMFVHAGEHVCPPLLEAIDSVVDREYMAKLPEENKYAYLDLILGMHPELIEAQKILGHMTDIAEVLDDWVNTLKEAFDQMRADGLDPFVVEDAWNTSNNDPILGNMTKTFGMELKNKADFLEKFYGE